jgi:hypothetical protein
MADNRHLLSYVQELFALAGYFPTKNSSPCSLDMQFPSAPHSAGIVARYAAGRLSTLPPLSIQACLTIDMRSS